LSAGRLAERREKDDGSSEKGKKVEKPGYPSAFVALVEKAATLQTTQKYFEELFGSTRPRLPITSTPRIRGDCQLRGEGSQSKVDGWRR